MLIERNDELKFNKLIATEGMVITDFKDGDDILEYNSSKLIYCPLSINLDKYREISDNEDMLLREQQEQRIKEIEENHNL